MSSIGLKLKTAVPKEQPFSWLYYSDLLILTINFNVKIFVDFFNDFTFQF